MPGGSSLRGEAVSDPDLGEEKARLGGVRLELMAELRHIDAQIMAVLEVVRSPDLFEKLPVGQHHAGMFHEDGEQTVLDGGEVHGTIVQELNRTRRFWVARGKS